jgi:hypothetical protein
MASVETNTIKKQIISKYQQAITDAIVLRNTGDIQQYNDIQLQRLNAVIRIIQDILTQDFAMPHEAVYEIYDTQRTRIVKRIKEMSDEERKMALKKVNVY